MTPYLSCDETVLRLHYTLAALPGGLRNTVAAWMRDHGINPDTIAEQTAIVRDPARGSLSWTTVSADGARTEHLRYGSVVTGTVPSQAPHERPGQGWAQRPLGRRARCTPSDGMMWPAHQDRQRSSRTTGDIGFVSGARDGAR